MLISPAVGGGSGRGGPLAVRTGSTDTPTFSNPFGGGGGGKGTPGGSARSISTCSNETRNPDSTRSLNTLLSSANGDLDGDPIESRGEFFPVLVTHAGDFVGDDERFLSCPPKEEPLVRTVSFGFDPPS